MSRETEKLFKQMNEYIDAHQDEIENDADMERIVQQFMEEHNQAIKNGHVSKPVEPTTSDDYLELAEEATSKKKRLEYAQKALELDADNLDAAHMVAELTAKSAWELLELLPPLIAKGDALMEREGFFRDGMGEFWGILETRPYMRLRYHYMQTLAECGMMRKAAREGERLLELCDDDNLGVRFDLVHIYAYLEDESAALAIYSRREEFDSVSTMQLLPLAVLYYKLGEFETALQYLQRLASVNKDTKKFVTAAVSGDFDKYMTRMSPYGYRPGCMDELIHDLVSYAYLFRSAPFFFDWAKQNLKVGKKRS